MAEVDGPDTHRRGATDWARAANVAPRPLRGLGDDAIRVPRGTNLSHTMRAYIMRSITSMQRIVSASVYHPLHWDKLGMRCR